MPGLQQQIPSAEYEALVDFYTSTHGQGWNAADGWLDPSAPSWRGVTVSGFQYAPETDAVLSVGSVTELVLYRNNLAGNLPESLGNLDQLETLTLGQNQLTGPIPAGLINLAHLKVLDLFQNQVTGVIPAGLGSLLNLTQLSLAYNALTGTIPDSLGYLPHLVGLGLSHNQLTGAVPASFANLTQLRVLALGHNQLSGEIPDFSVTLQTPRFRPFFGLVWFTLEIKENCFDVFHGSPVRTVVEKLVDTYASVLCEPQNASCVPGLQQQIPPTEYTALMEIYSVARSHQWGGDRGWADPAATFWEGVAVSGVQYDPATLQILNVGRVTALNLRAVPLVSFPGCLTDLPYLESLNLSNAGLTGTIPAFLGDLAHLQVLLLDRNQLHGAIPESLGNLHHLQVLSLNENQLSDSIPASLGQLEDLEELWLNGNSLSGSIPESLGNLVNLQTLSLEHNQLSGTIPETFVGLLNAREVFLAANQLSGPIPDGLNELTSLYVLHVNRNCFDISPGSQPRLVIHNLHEAGVAVWYGPQNLGCGPVAPGDLDNDGSVDSFDLESILGMIRSRSTDPAYDLNHDGKVDIADARFLVLHFTNPDGSAATP